MRNGRGQEEEEGGDKVESRGAVKMSLRYAFFLALQGVAVLGPHRNE